MAKSKFEYTFDPMRISLMPVAEFHRNDLDYVLSFESVNEKNAYMIATHDDKSVRILVTVGIIEKLAFWFINKKQHYEGCPYIKEALDALEDKLRKD